MGYLYAKSCVTSSFSQIKNAKRQKTTLRFIWILFIIFALLPFLVFWRSTNKFIHPTINTTIVNANNDSNDYSNPHIDHDNSGNYKFDVNLSYQVAKSYSFEFDNIVDNHGNKLHSNSYELIWDSWLYNNNTKIIHKDDDNYRGINFNPQTAALSVSSLDKFGNYVWTNGGYYQFQILFSLKKPNYLTYHNAIHINLKVDKIATKQQAVINKLKLEDMTGGVELKPDASKTDIIYQEQVTNNVDELNNDLIASNNPIYDNVKNSWKLTNQIDGITINELTGLLSITNETATGYHLIEIVNEIKSANYVTLIPTTRKIGFWVCETNNNFQFLINNQEVIELTYDYAKYTNDLKLKNTNNNFVDKTLNDTNGFIPLANYRIKDVKSSDSKISYNTSTGKITIDPKLDANTYKLEFDWQYGKTNTTSIFYPGNQLNESFNHTIIYINIKPKDLGDVYHLINNSQTNEISLNYDILTKQTLTFTTNLDNKIVTTNNNRTDTLTTTWDFSEINNSYITFKDNCLTINSGLVVNETNGYTLPITYYVTNKNYVSKKNAVEVKLYIKKANFNNVTISIAKFSTYNNRLLLAPGYDIQQFDIILNDLPEELYNDTTITYTLTTPINKCLLVNNGPKKVALKVLDGLTHGQAFIFSISVTLTNPNYSSKTITKNNFEIYVSDFVSEKIFTISFWPPGSQYWLMFYSETTNYISRYRLNFSNEITGLWNLSRYRYQPSEVAKNLGWPNDIKYTVRPNLLFAICFSGLTSVYDYLSLNVKYKFTLEIACGDWISRIYSEPNWTRFNPNGNNHTYSERWYDGEVGH